MFLLIQFSQQSCRSPTYIIRFHTIRQEDPLQSFPDTSIPVSGFCWDGWGDPKSHTHNLFSKNLSVSSFPCLQSTVSLTVNLPTLARFGIWIDVIFLNHQVLVSLCLTVSSSIYLFLLTFYSKWQQEIRPHLQHFVWKYFQLNNASM